MMNRAVTVVVTSFIMSCAGTETPTVRAPVTRLEVHPERLQIPVGDDRVVHVEPFSFDTPLVPVHINFWISRGADVAALNRYSTPFITVRGLKVGEAELTVTVEDFVAKLPIVVSDVTVDIGPIPRPLRWARVATPGQSHQHLVRERTSELARRLLEVTTAWGAPQNVLDSLCLWIQRCEKFNVR